MPKRSNSFQRVVAALYESLAPTGATVAESVLVREEQSGADREVDVYVTIPALATTLRIAIECRDHERPQSVDWIDNLLGKYQSLPVDKVIAVSDSGFTSSAIEKAKNTNIELVSANKIDDVDWAARLLVKEWHSLHLMHNVMIVGAFDQDDNEVVLARREALNEPWTFKDGTSELLPPTILNIFSGNYAETVKNSIHDFVAPKFDKYVHGDLKYAEFTIESEWKIEAPGATFNLRKFIFGVGTRIAWIKMDVFHRVIGEFAVSEITEANVAITIVHKKDDGPLRLSIRTA